MRGRPLDDSRLSDTGFLTGGGEMADLIRDFDWSATSIGPIADWPQSLRTATALLLRSPVAIVMLWSDHGYMIYNDAYSVFAGGRHPQLLGSKVLEGWPEVADFNAHVMAVGLGGGTLAYKDQELTLHRHGAAEKVWMDLDYSPVLDEGGAPAGVIAIVIETTARVQAERHLIAEHDLIAQMFEQAPGFMAMIEGPRHRITMTNPAYDRLIGRDDVTGMTVAEALPEAAEQGFVTILDEVYATGVPFTGTGVLFQVDDRTTGRIEDRHVDFVYQPIRDAHGGVTGIFLQGSDVSQRVAGEQALRRSETALQQALSAGEGIGSWDWDVVQDEVRADARFAKMYGVDPERARTGAPIDEFFGGIHPDDQARVQATIARALSGEGHFSSEYRLLQKDGGIRWVAAQGRATFAEDGTPLRLPGVTFDITRRKAADARQAALIELGDTLRNISDPGEIANAASRILAKTMGVSRAGYGTIDPEAETITIAQDWNAPGTRSIAGVLHFRDYGSYIDQLKAGETVVIPDADTDPRTSATAEALKAIHAWSLINMPLLEQGRFVALVFVNCARAREWSEDDLSLMRDFAERVRVATERARAELALRAANETLEHQVQARTAELAEKVARLREIFETSFGFQGMLTPEGRLVDANKTSLAAARVRLPDVAGQLYWETPWFADTPGMADTIREGVAQAVTGDVFRQEVLLKLPVGGWRWFDLVMRAIRDPAGEVIGIAPEASETTERRMAEEALRQSQKLEAMGQLTGGVAHDFNNLLTPIIGSLDLLQRRGIGGEREQRLVAGGLQSAERAKTLVQRLLAFARRQPLQPQPVDVAQVIGSMRDLVASSSGPRVRLEIALAEALPAATAEVNQLEMALLNLAVNARDAMPDGGTLTMRADTLRVGPGDAKVAPGTYVRIAVSDTGSGMDAATLARAIEPFFSTKGIGKGTGLGLSMVHGLTSQLGGGLRIDSRVGLGTTVEMLLPVAETAAETGAGVSTETAAETGIARASGRVLLVDDEDGVRVATADMLTELGYDVTEAECGADALDWLDRRGFDLLISDHMMPGMAGTEVARAALARFPALRVLIISGYAEVESVAADLPRLTKPFRAGDLAEAIAGLGE
ncbi:PAS domain-containing protein [Sphingomonas sp. GB1N7]|uniref:PAS domain-containing protein n=1 Tax=Parasphingomonas caseinilytica TaxID=3096158 RepID=UPI002FC91F05